MTIDPEKQRLDEEYVPEDDTIIGKAFKWSILVIAAIAVLIAGGWWLTRDAPEQENVLVRDPIEAPSSTTTATATRTCCSSTPTTGPTTGSPIGRRWRSTGTTGPASSPT